MKLTYIYKTSRGNLRERKLTCKELDQILLGYDKLADINNTNSRKNTKKEKLFDNGEE